jgi:pimeloyl-ACP methyl ester carboxylesterase
MVRTTRLLFLFTGLCLILPGCSGDRSGFIPSADGVRIYYRVQGRGQPAIVLVHGWLGDMTGWENQVTEFAREHRVVTLDLAGFGRSSLDREQWTMAAFGQDVVSVVEHLDLDRFVLVGHSMGSAAVLEAAPGLSQRVMGIVAVDVFQNVEEKFSASDIALEVGKRIPFLNQRLAEEPDSLRLKNAWISCLEHYFAWRTHDLLPALQALQIPIICINSDRKTTDVAMIRRYAPAFDLHIVPDVGHGVMVEAPTEFNHLLREIISGW